MELSTLKDRVIELNSTTENKQRVVDHAFDFLGNVSLVWQGANIDSQVKMQDLVFPNSICFDLEAKSFGTVTLSPIYRLLDQKKNPSMKDESLLVNLTTTQVETLFDELEYIKLQLKAFFTDLPNTLLPESRDSLSPSRIE